MLIFRRLLYIPKEAKEYAIHNTHTNASPTKGHMDFELIKEAKKAIRGIGKSVDVA